jgi:hypothetical protein
VSFTVGIAALCAALGTNAGPSPAPSSATSLAGTPGSLVAARKLAGTTDAPWMRAKATQASSSCVAELCAPRVTIPGMQPVVVRPSRTELAVHYLGRTNLTFLSSVARGLLTTGLRLEYTPPVLAGPSSAPTRWGTVFLRVRFRVDATNVPMIPR